MERILTENLRGKLKKPFGRLVSDVSELKAELKHKRIISVGDKVTESLLGAGIEPNVCIYDGKTKRQDIGILSGIKGYNAAEIKVNNPAGSITEDASDAIEKAVKSGKRTKIFVSGEEDLLTLAAIEKAPAGWIVLYGQPDQGIVLVNVDKSTKNKVEKILDEMSVK